MMKTPLRSALLLAGAPLLLVAACHQAPAHHEAKAVTTSKATASGASGPAAAAPTHAAAAAGRPVTTKAELPTLTPAALAQQLKSKHEPTLIQVGFAKLYAQAHIPGSIYAGPGVTPAGITSLQQHVAKLPHDTPIVVYCGCCPWSHCPNVLPAYQALQRLGFTHVKVLHIADNFGKDWAARGYPVASGM